jgi:hypothetical protein
MAAGWVALRVAMKECLLAEQMAGKMAVSLGLMMVVLTAALSAG